jgi:hypothetical protein
MTGTLPRYLQSNSTPVVDPTIENWKDVVWAGRVKGYVATWAETEVGASGSLVVMPFAT